MSLARRQQKTNFSERATGSVLRHCFSTFRVLCCIFPLKKKKTTNPHIGKKKKRKLKVTAKTDQFHQKCSRELFSQPWKLCGSLHPSKLHCPDRFYLPTKNTERRYQLITWLVLLLAEPVFVFQEQNQVLDHKIFRNKARVSLSFAKMQ